MSFDHGTLILHLGMSGSLRVLPAQTPPEKHDHFDLLLANNTLMRLRDPRRFGAVLWHPEPIGNQRDISRHKLLKELGPEPLLDGFDAQHLYRATRKRSAAIKLVIMDSHVVVGVGNIYASEALFSAGINPKTQARRLSLARVQRLCDAVNTTLERAIRAGGSSLRDFVKINGELGYFQLDAAVYGRSGEPCRQCGTPIRQIRQGQRSTFYCVVCQR